MLCIYWYCLTLALLCFSYYVGFVLIVFLVAYLGCLVMFVLDWCFWVLLGYLLLMFVIVAWIVGLLIVSLFLLVDVVCVDLIAFRLLFDCCCLLGVVYLMWFGLGYFVCFIDLYVLWVSGLSLLVVVLVLRFVCLTAFNTGLC